MTADQRGADTVAATHEQQPFAPASGVGLRGPDPIADSAIPLPHLDLEAARRARAALVRAEIRMGRLRLVSYCLTLSACVFALMTFMYVVQGAGDSDAKFLSLGIMFGAVTGALLWAAVRVTRFSDLPAHP